MSKVIHKLSLFLFKKFKIIWILLTIGILISAFYANWNINQKRAYKDLKEVAINLSNNIDGFIEDLLQEIYALPVYGKKIVDCKSDLYPFLEHITLNNPKISGVIISDNKHNLFCSTLPNNKDLIATPIRSRSIIGPYNLPLFDQPVYLIQQKMGNYLIGILVIASVLKSELQTDKNQSTSIALYNEYEKKNIFRIRYTEQNKNWVLSNTQETDTQYTSLGLVAIEKLQSINGVSVVVSENNKTIRHNFWYSQTITILIVLICSFILYALIKNMMTKRYSLQGAIKLAIKNEEFYPVYQPLFDCDEERFTGVEVLLRWENEDSQIIMPDFFIAEAEATGLIVPITLQIIEIAFKEFRSLLEERSYFHLAFNISALHFTDSIFFNQFHKLIEKYNISPHQIIFEITERELLDKNDTTFINKMQELRQAGFSLAVDDYGTGHASISYLQHFPFNYLKIDKLFVQAIGSNDIIESLNDAIIQMAKGLNLVTIAEGVETKDQANYLANNGVRLQQGWYYSKGLSIAELTALLKGEKI
ncbi:TPA: EAL domain-containing protein [Legionella pneumophila]|uniref:EAL domain-containing protein n=9 Tax=Legionella pneumophila TaxID=446 RepID=A0A3A6VWH0_LEGPN|nr:EAL domain-containing protein [Legionella pneumophila]ERH42440.1 diguanylate phosphodiesterase [Legionella pneumophila str. Leg01/11]AEW51672.1 Rtn protein [Legionella pneumophila subsp. pneumophila ATCC 43290]AGH53823.1 Rtn protein [Legionella pneumophila subsp. pneumophila LPE509]ANN95501.1 diguanylate phosphodiesterase [Legionella pneumophila]ERB42854.1 diguanylate phosphodiesterase [Legionella pneumophila str. 121004]